MSVSHFLGAPNLETWPNDAAQPTGGPGDDVECSRAYQMVMPFASSHEKAEAMARKMKAGCVADKKTGGCKVKAKVMWEVLENAMGEE